VIKVRKSRYASLKQENFECGGVFVVSRSRKTVSNSTHLFDSMVVSPQGLGRATCSSGKRIRKVSVPISELLRRLETTQAPIPSVALFGMHNL
jgi:hypothetical protein